MALSSSDTYINDLVLNRLNLSQLKDKTSASTIATNELYMVYNEKIDNRNFYTLDEVKALPVSTFANSMKFISENSLPSGTFKYYDSTRGVWIDCTLYKYDNTNSEFTAIEYVES